MRIFKDSETAYLKIAGEMLNIELGKYVFENGQFIELNKQRPMYRKYPMIVTDNSIYYIYSNVGIIYTPTNIDIKEFIDNIIVSVKRLETIYDLYKFAKNYVPIMEVSNYISIKAKPHISYDKDSKTLVDSALETSGYRKIYTKDKSKSIVLSGDSIKLSQRCLTNCIHAWFVRPITDLLSEVFINDHPDRYIGVFQHNEVISIIYDKNNIFNMTDGTFRTNNMEISMLYSSKNLIHNSFEREISQLRSDYSFIGLTSYKENNIRYLNSALNWYYILNKLGNHILSSVLPRIDRFYQYGGKIYKDSQIHTETIKQQIIVPQNSLVNLQNKKFCYSCNNILIQWYYVQPRIINTHMEYTPYCFCCFHTQPKLLTAKYVLKVKSDIKYSNIIPLLNCSDDFKQFLLVVFNHKKSIHVHHDKTQTYRYTKLNNTLIFDGLTSFQVFSESSPNLFTPNSQSYVFFLV